MWCCTWVMCCHLTPNTFNVLSETSRHTKQYRGCTKSTPWRSPGSTCQALERATHCSPACQPGGRCWRCTRWFAGFVVCDFMSRRRRNWRTLVPVKRLVLQHFLHSTFVQGLRAKCHYNCRSVCARVAGWWVHVAARHGPVDQLCLRADFREAEVGFNTIHCAPVQRHVVVVA